MTKKYFSSKNTEENFSIINSDENNKKEIENIIKTNNFGDFDKLKGEYSFAFEKDNNLYLFRDVIGIIPICYFFDEKNEELLFSFERKYLPFGAVELPPREYLIFDKTIKKLEIKKREYYFDVDTTIDGDYQEIKKKVYDMFVLSIQKRLPKSRDEPVGLLFSGGTDSTLMALILESLGQKFICYTASIKAGNTIEGEDIIYSREISERYNFNWKLCELEFVDFEKYTKLVINTIEDRGYTKVSVALPLFICLEQAKLDGVKQVFSGIGSEEVFADYKRNQDINNINEICLEGLGNLWIRDLYREYTMAKFNNLKIEFPFLDNDFVNYSIRINPDFKINKKTGVNKVILREILRDLKLPDKFVNRKKRAAQYGSKSARIFERVAEKKKQKKQEFLNKL